jgi:hypothetical protein
LAMVGSCIALTIPPFYLPQYTGHVHLYCRGHLHLLLLLFDLEILRLTIYQSAFFALRVLVHISAIFPFYIYIRGKFEVHTYLSKDHNIIPIAQKAGMLVISLGGSADTGMNVGLS